MYFKELVLGFLLLFIAGVSTLLAQEKTSFAGNISADISFGAPIYMGDFSTFGGGAPIYNGNNLLAPTTSNATSVSASLTYPLNKFAALKFMGGQSTLFFGDVGTQVFFKNSIAFFTPMLQITIPVQNLNVYGFMGPSIGFSSDALIQTSEENAKQVPNEDVLTRFGAIGGVGIDYLLFANIALFAEADINFTGTDRFDGYNGYDPQTLEFEDEKPYIQRDRIANIRGGIRLYFNGESQPTAERKFDQQLDAYYENPSEDDSAKDEDEEEEEKLPKEWRELGIKTRLENFTLMVNKVFTLDQVRSQKAVGEKILSELQVEFPDIQLLLLAETTGFTIHYGEFKSSQEAKRFVSLLRRYYSEAVVRYHAPKPKK